MGAAAEVDDLTRRLRHFRRVVVWGHPWGSHTHSYVHAGFVRALRALGVETLWTNDRSLLDAVGTAQTLFITEGQVVDGLPHDRTCRYVLHNVDYRWYAEMPDQVLVLQVHTLDTYRHEAGGAPGERLNAYTWVTRGEDGVTALYQPWATDLLPGEFDLGNAPPPAGGAPYAVWIGTIGGGEFGNEQELAPFRAAVERSGVAFLHRQRVSLALHRRLVAGSAVAPSIVGSWQLAHGYLPCRIFKNISYGQLGLTNSPVVASIFEADVPVRADTAELLSVGLALGAHRALRDRQRREVEARHTFLNRLDTILSYLP